MRKLHFRGLLVAFVIVGAIPVALALAATAAAPAVTTAGATSVGSAGAVLSGSVNPEGQQTQYAFQWGPTAGYGHETGLTSAGSGSTAALVNATLGGLAAGSAYHFRVIALNLPGSGSAAISRSRPRAPRRRPRKPRSLPRARRLTQPMRASR